MWLTENRKSKNYTSGVKHIKSDSDDMSLSTDSTLLNDSGMSNLLQNSENDPDLSTYSQTSSCVSDTTFESISSDSFNESITSNLSNSLLDDPGPSCPPYP